MQVAWEMAQTRVASGTCVPQRYGALRFWLSVESLWRSASLFGVCTTDSPSASGGGRIDCSEFSAAATVRRIARAPRRPAYECGATSLVESATWPSHSKQLNCTVDS